jgi:hypothetical protein
LTHDDANRQVWEEQTLSGYPMRRVETARDGDGNRGGLWVQNNGQAIYGVYFEATNRRLSASDYSKLEPRTGFLNCAGRGDRARLLSIQALQPKVHPLHRLSSSTTLPAFGLFQPRGSL